MCRLAWTSPTKATLPYSSTPAIGRQVLASTPTALAAGVSASTNPAFSASRTEETTYDDRGRIIAESSPEGVLGYTYDALGRMTSTSVFAAVDDPSVDTPERTNSYGYDILGRLVSVTEDSTPANTSDDPQLETEYTFDLAGRADTTTTTDPSKSESVTTDYDALGRLVYADRHRYIEQRAGVLRLRCTFRR